MNPTPLDPWNDAALIAGRLGSPYNRLIVVLSAEAWCEKCRQLRPHFDAIALDAHERELMLWLDIEDHLPFIGDYLPASLPELLIYRSTTLEYRQVIESNLNALDAALSAPPMADPGPDPGIANRLALQDWAQAM
ncbi:thioredoxin domain-containing protein [Parazoarcus communis]|uniref:Thioredoxin n=1 Tax=Parazoarcus communis SWub3 = DSM 12120 TaxID=1121029 RepID=A0A323V5J6_9RHOO|nr:thioredoxin domain-containing protein [Parazoarcus communis]NMG72729.1 thioredoxin [Parazoarcus communis SWub3 = DSM 12120]PZA15448.1 thioredoxin [Azoarcus communis] [Parazoarcus communis SWub3 = DSM 12120]